ncbi:Lrp/AsnC family transcriptional regulator [Halococcoides cellulosivorans]|uniref:AsnC family transcriptional regulator n=1 Tax=Halococcoides cellulosivorans TaxID=1679096 RepID=A0A2R4X416_9EURY|nr:Lrp/AsnC family transcriptional regulator [Halococcoides cellulosivorans]AWB28541.1 AsnC family transcriptional regulator [Halococcoides cellulosivorans]
MVDATDRRLIDAMLADGRASLREIGERSDVSPTTVSARLEGLESVVGSVVPLIDYEQLGYETAIVRLRVDGPSREGVLDRLDERPELTSVYAVTGPTDVIAIGSFENREALDDTHREILALDGVRDVEVAVVRSVAASFEQFPVADRA